MFCEFLSKFYVVSLFILLISNASSSQSISWSQINNGIVDLDFMDICVNNQDYIFVCTWYGAGLYRSTNGGANWTLQSPALPGNIKTCEIDISSNGTLFFGGRSGQQGSSSNDYGIGIYKSTDNGNSWTQTVLSHGIAETIATGENGLVFVGFQAIPDYYDLRGIHRSTDYGVTWTHVANASEIFYVTEIAIHPNNDIYAGTYQDGLFRSLDNGNTWSKINGGLTKINSIVFNLIGEIYVGTGDNGVYKSTDNGNTWSQINNGLNNLNVEELVFNSKQELFAGTYGSGVYYSGNSGASWYNISDGLSNKDVFCLTINSNSELFAGTIGGGIYKSTNTTSVDETSNQLPLSYKLSQNYPNPFNPTTKIKYGIPKSSQVQLIVYDNLGREVTTLVNEQKPAGSYEVEFNASNLSNGVYFYELRAGDFRDVKKLVLLK